MKKTAVALLTLAATTAAFATPAPGSFYLGAKWGQSSFHKTVKLNIDNDLYHTGSGMSFGVYGGYVLNNHFSFELGYQHISPNKYLFKTNGTLENKQNIFTLDVKANQYLGDNLNVYGLAGLGFVVNKLDKGLLTYGADMTAPVTKTTVAPYLGAGVQYFFNNSLAIGAEYSMWLSSFRTPGTTEKDGPAIMTHQMDSKTNVTNFVNKYNPNTNLFAATLTYYFGNNAPATVKPVVTMQKHSYSAESLFALNSYALNSKVAAKDFADIIKNYHGATSATVTVVGYTDRTGSNAYNLKLSLKRAQTVAKYLESQGINSNNVVVQGEGSANPVTNGCYNVKTTKALISCLAPDRRVDVTLYTYINGDQ